METAEIMTAYGSIPVTRAMDEYITLKASVSWGERTTRNYTSTLKLFGEEVAKLVGREPWTMDLNDLIVSTAISNRWPETGRTTTYHGIVSRIKTFLAWLPVAGYSTGSLAIFLEAKPKYPEVQVGFLTREKAELAFRAAYAYSPRDAWMIWIGYKLARRVGELRTMRVRDFNPTPTPDAPYGSYRFTEHKTKGGQVTERLNATEREAMDGWLADYERLAGMKPKGDWYLFPATISTGVAVKGQKRQRRLNPTQPIADVSPIWRTAYEEAGIYEKGFGSHGGRRGNLTDELYDMEAAGIPDAMLHVQRKARHKDRRTTARYIRQQEGERQSFEVRMKVDDIRSGKAPAPTPQPEEKDEKKSGGQIVERSDNVVYARFGPKGA